MPLIEAPMSIAEIEEDEDIFAEALHKERVENAVTKRDYVGGDTASFRPQVYDSWLMKMSLKSSRTVTANLVPSYFGY